VGALFAVLYPLMQLSLSLGFLLKFSTGLLLCILAYGDLKRKKDWEKYFLFTALFFSLSFLFGGALSAITQGKLPRLKTLVTPLGFLCLATFCAYLFYILYKRSSILQLVYDCVITSGEKSVTAQGFFDSGNRVSKGGVPVCFLSPELVYELWGYKFDGGYVCDEMAITTVTGVKKAVLYKGSLQIKMGKKTRTLHEVYFSPSVNMISREYTVLLHSRIFEEGEDL
jgi:hypothetical protein